MIDFTQVMLGPCCTQMLADYGADVIKVEKDKVGDLSRCVGWLGPGWIEQPGLLFAEPQQAQPRARFEARGGARRRWR